MNFPRGDATSLGAHEEFHAVTNHVTVCPYVFSAVEGEVPTTQLLGVYGRGLPVQRGCGPDRWAREVGFGPSTVFFDQLEAGPVSLLLLPTSFASSIRWIQSVPFCLARGECRIGLVQRLTRLKRSSKYPNLRSLAQTRW